MYEQLQGTCQGKDPTHPNIIGQPPKYVHNQPLTTNQCAQSCSDFAECIAYL